MIEIGRGNLLVADVEALVNTVNTVGVMGKGIALQFKRAFPENYHQYHVACEQGGVRLGSVLVHETGRSGRHRFVINFPTKGHWRAKSHLADIEAGLLDLVRVVRTLEVTSLAVPALGCGLGGLAWPTVREMMEKIFADLPEVRVVMFAPEGPPRPEDMPVAAIGPALTPERALLLVALHRYFLRAKSLESISGVSELEIQKLLYFVQRLGQRVKLNFTRGRYGPYDHRLHRVLADLEGHHIIGFGDDSGKWAP